MNETDAQWDPALLVSRGLGWGAIVGGAFGALFWTAWSVSHREIAPMLLVWLAWLVGALVGGLVGFAAGMVLALGGRWAVRRMHRARLITGTAAAAVPLAFMSYLGQSAWIWSYVAPAVGPIGFAVTAGLAAVLLTPRIVNGSPPPRERSRKRTRAGNGNGAGVTA